MSDASAKNKKGQEWEQPAELVILCAYGLHNVRLLLNSGIGKPYDPQTGTGVVGKNYAYQITSSVDVFFDDKLMNPFIGAGALGMVVDEFNGDNFDHGPLGFLGGRESVDAQRLGDEVAGAQARIESRIGVLVDELSTAPQGAHLVTREGGHILAI